MKTDEIERRIAALEKDLAGPVGHDRAAAHADPRGGRRASRPAARKDLDRFVDDVCRQLPNVIDVGQARRAQAVPPGVPRGRLQAVGRGGDAGRSRCSSSSSPRRRWRSCGRTRTTARSASPRRWAATRGGSTCRSTRIKYDVGVVALMFGGVALMAVNLMAGGVLAIAGPAILAMFARGKIHEEFKKRAKELAPEVMRETAKKVAPEARRADRRVRAEARRLGGQRGRGAAPRGGRGAAAPRRTPATPAQGDEAKATASVEGQAAALAKVTERIEKLRAELWAPPERVRVADATPATALDHAPRSSADTLGRRASASFSKRFMKRRQSLTTRGPGGRRAHGVVGDARDREAQRREATPRPQRPRVSALREGRTRSYPSRIAEARPASRSSPKHHDSTVTIRS